MEQNQSSIGLKASQPAGRQASTITIRKAEKQKRRSLMVLPDHEWERVPEAIEAAPDEGRLLSQSGQPDEISVSEILRGESSGRGLYTQNPSARNLPTQRDRHQ